MQAQAEERTRRGLLQLAWLWLWSAFALGSACGGGGSEVQEGSNDGPAACGPREGVVERVIDGDTIVLTTGERIRYLLVDTPETSAPVDCFGPEATTFNRALVEGNSVELTYDEECSDQYDRLLAYVAVEGRSVNELLLARGFACVLHIPPNGANHLDAYRRIEEEAQVGQVGLWAACVESPCD